ncbi:MAG: DNA polymerase III subunit beta [Sulfuricurvum sp. PC08-66]|nr:MAG: DNA polymerase III subunit beta [Sulfuricurvum sp. PC08-66]
MRIVIAKNVLESMLTHLQPFLEKRDNALITSHIFIQTQQNSLQLRATDHEIGLSIASEFVKIQEPGALTANGKKLLDIIKILKEDEITLELIGDMLHVKQKTAKFKLPTFDANEYPTFVSVQGKAKIELDSTQLIRSLKKITPAIDNNNPKFELNGALIDIKKESMNLVATDTRRLAVVSIQRQNEKELALIIPKKAIVEIQKLFVENIEIYYDETYLIIQTAHYQFFTKLINGKFPDYQRIIPTQAKHTLTLQKAPMVEAIKLITTVSNDIKVTFYSDRVVFQSLSDDNNDAQTEWIFDTGLTAPFILAINSRYILDFFGQIDSSDFFMKLNESNQPFVVEADTLKTIIMPIVI